MRSKAITVLCCVLITNLAVGQGSVFGFKGGPSLGFQSWNEYNRDALLAWHAIAFVESLTENNEFGLFLQGGYHVRGSAIRVNSFATLDPISNQSITIQGFTTRYEFHNFSIAAGGKQKFQLSDYTSYYYLFGIRGDYTLKTRFEDGRNFGIVDDQYVRKFNGGLIVGGGLEYQFADLVGGMIELTINPDFTRQYEQLPINNVTSPNSQNSFTLRENIARNTTVELSIGIRFTRKIEYID